MKSQVYVLGTRSKLAALLLGIVVVGVIAMLLVVGFTVLIALTAIGTLLGLAAIARRAVRARLGHAAVQESDRLVLDPAKQVFPATPVRTLEDRQGARGES